MFGFRKYFFLILAMVLVFSACDEPVVEKPKKLVPRDRMVDMLTDMHIEIGRAHV